MYNAIIVSELRWRGVQRYVKEKFGQTSKIKCHPADRDMGFLSEDEIIFSYAISKFQHLVI